MAWTARSQPCAAAGWLQSVSLNARAASLSCRRARPHHPCAPLQSSRVSCARWLNAARSRRGRSTRQPATARANPCGNGLVERAEGEVNVAIALLTARRNATRRGSDNRLPRRSVFAISRGRCTRRKRCSVPGRPPWRTGQCATAGRRRLTRRAEDAACTCMCAAILNVQTAVFKAKNEKHLEQPVWS